MEYNIGDSMRCPECGNMRAEVIWKSRDGKTVGVKCPRSGDRHKSDCVILIDV